MDLSKLNDEFFKSLEEDKDPQQPLLETPELLESATLKKPKAFDLSAIDSPDFIDSLKNDASSQQNISVDPDTSVSVLNGVKQNPDKYANALKISNDLGLPVPTVMSDFDRYNNDSRFKELDLSKLRNENPYIYQWFSDRDNAALSHDDVPALRKMETLLRNQQVKEDGTTKRHSVFGNIARYMGERGGQFLGQGTQFISRVIPDEINIPLPTTIPYFQGIRFNLKEGVEASAEDLKQADFNHQLWAEVQPETLEKRFAEEGMSFDLTGDFLYLAAEQIGGSVPEMLSTLTGPGFAFTVISHTERLAQENVETAGRSEVTATDLATTFLFAFGMTALEKVGATGIMDAIVDKKGLAEAFGAGLLKHLLKKYGKAAVKEGATEFAQEGIIEYLATRINTGVDVTVAEALHRGAWGAALGTVGSVQLSAPIGVPLDLIQSRNLKNRTDTEREQDTIDTLIQVINEESKLKQRSPEKLNEFLNQVAPDQSILVDVKSFTEALNKLQGDLKEGEVKDGEVGPGLPEQKVDITANPLLARLSAEIQDANDLGTTIEISVGDFAQHIVGTEFESMLRPHVKLSENANTQADINVSQKIFQEMQSEILAAAEEDQKMFDEAKALTDNITSQLKRSGRYDRRTSKLISEVFAARMTMRAREKGISIQEAFDQSGFGGFIGPHEETQQRIDDANVLNAAQQSGYTGTDRGEAVEWTRAVEKGLDMSLEGRMARAAEMGFDVEQIMYHWTGAEEFEDNAFVPSSGGKYGPGIYLSNDKWYGEKYVDSGTPKRLALHIRGEIATKEQVFAADAKAREILATKEFEGYEFNKAYWEAMREVLEPQGFAGFEYEGETVVFDPTNIRSVNAAFDPDYSDSANLLAQTDKPMGKQISEDLDNITAFDSAMPHAQQGDYATNRALKVDLQERILEEAKQQGIDLTQDSPEVDEYLTRVGVRDALFAMQTNENAVGWYDLTVGKALELMAIIHPEIAQDADKKFAFTWALAVTSNGIKVDRNFELAEAAYAHYKKTGKMPTNIQAGNAQKAINDSMKLFNDLVDQMGIKTLNKFMSSEFTVAQIQKMGLKITGENAGTIVRGAAILGPKIGNGFFSNLNGFFDKLTMDRWLMRTWGRWTGTLIEERPDMVKTKSEELKDAIRELKKDKAATKAFEAALGAKLTLKDPKALAKQINKASVSAATRKIFDTTAAGGNIRRAGNALFKYLDGQKEAPQNGNERNRIRKIFTNVLEELQNSGYDNLTMSDLQALVWYPERRLYDMVKSADDVSAGYTDDEAPDYANAAMDLVRKKGATDDQVTSALDKAEKDHETRISTESARRADGEPGVGGRIDDGGFAPRERGGFLKKNIFVRARLNRSSNAKARSYSKPSQRRTGEVRGLEYKVDRTFGNILTAAEMPAVTMIEIEQTEENAQMFENLIQQSKDQSDYGAAVYVYPAEEYQQMRLFLTDDKQSGFAIKSDGDIVSVFSNGGGKVHSMLALAVEQGGTKLDAFDTVLPDIYSINGFKEVGRDSWNEDYKPDDWNKQTFGLYNNGEPDIVYMEYDPAFSPIYGVLNQSAYHGTPHLFDRFSLDAMGTGEGAQAYGWGLYFASKRSIAEFYAKELGYMSLNALNDEAKAKLKSVLNYADGASYTVETFIQQTPDWTNESVAEMLREEAEIVSNSRNGNPYYVTAYNTMASMIESGDLSVEQVGNLFQVDIPENDVLLDWDALLDEQPTDVMQKLRSADWFKFAEESLENSLDYNPTGADLYHWLLEDYSPQEASELLNSIGIPGLRYLDGTSRGTDGDSHNYVIWDEKSVTVEAVNDELRAAEALTQNNKEQTIKGQYDIGSKVISLFESSDVSTAMHEMAHFFLDLEQNDPDSVHMKSVKQWWSTNAESIAEEAGVTPEDVQSWIANDTSGDETVDQQIWRATHEQFARAFEGYLMNGDAPSMDLKRAFRAFAKMLKQIYRSIMGLNVNVNEEITEVFDRMLASEEQILLAKNQNRYAPLFTDAAMAGMTEEQYEAYLQKQEEATNTEEESLLKKMMKQLRQRETKWWNEERAKRADEIEDELRKQPVHVARDVLTKKTGEIKLDRASVKALLGVEKLPAQFRNMTLTGGMGMNLDDAAAQFGFESGEEMVDVIMKTPSLKTIARDQAQTEMIKKHGDILNDGTIEAMAQDAVHDEVRGELILAELKALNGGRQTRGVDTQSLKSLAEENIGKLALKDIRPDKYRRAEIKAAQDARSALDKGDKVAAKQAKIRQAMNFHLYRAAQDAHKQAERMTKFMAKFRKKSVREILAKAGNGYLEQIDGLLARFEFRKSVSMKATEKARKDIGVWAAERSEAGDNIQLTDEALSENYRHHYKEVPFEELMGIFDSVKNIDHVARYADQMRTAQDRLDFEDVKAQVLEHLDNLPDKFNYDARHSVTDSVKKSFRKNIARFTKIPFLVRWLDGGKIAGLMDDLIMRPMVEAARAENQLWSSVGEPVVKMLQGLSRKDKARLNKKFRIPELAGTRTGETITGSMMLSIALNTGNAGNLRKMMLGEGWAKTEDEVSIDNPILQAIFNRMTKEDFDLVQSIWDQIDTLHPLMAEVHKASSGLDIAKVEATPVVTPFGTYRGGYYPVKYDTYRSDKALKHKEQDEAVVNSMFDGTGFIKPVADTGAKVERTDYFAPIHLGLDVVPNHIQEVIHYITHFDAVRQAHRLTNDNEIADAIKSRVGIDEYKLFKPWLNDIAKNGRASETKEMFEKTLQKLRFGVTLGAMGFKASTGIMQLFGLSTAAAEVGGGYTLQAMRRVYGSPASFREALEEASAVSKVMPDRLKTMDREIMNAFKQLEGKHGTIAFLQEISMKHIALIQTYMVDLPTWYAMYQKEYDAAIAELDAENFANQQEMDAAVQSRAVRAADWAVENLQGSGNIHNAAAVMRSKSEYVKMFTMFMTFFSSLWNIQRDLIRGIGDGRFGATDIAMKMMFLYLIPVAIEYVMREGFPDDDDEPEEYMQGMLTSLALYPATSVPVLRDVMSGVMGDYGYNMTPVAGMIERGLGGIKRLDDPTQSNVKNVSKLISAYAGVPGVNQFWATGEHIQQIVQEGEDATVRELLFGPERD